jgi:hypothetical protein
VSQPGTEPRLFASGDITASHFILFSSNYPLLSSISASLHLGLIFHRQLISAERPKKGDSGRHVFDLQSG